MRDPFVPNIFVRNGPCITSHVCLMWGRSLHPRRTLCPNLVVGCLWCLVCGVVEITSSCRSEAQRSRRLRLLHRRGGRVLSIYHHGHCGTCWPLCRYQCCMRSPCDFVRPEAHQRITKKGGTLEKSTIAKLNCFWPKSQETILQSIGKLWGSVERRLAAYSWTWGRDLRGLWDAKVERDAGAG